MSDHKMTPSTRLRLTPVATLAFPDIGTRLGTEVYRSGPWIVVRWSGDDSDVWLPLAAVEPVEPEP
jgi:hypothetical protein